MPSIDVNKVKLYAKKIYKELDSKKHKFLLKKMTEMRGYYDTVTHDIAIDYRDELFPTLIHEVLHHIHPEWNEDEILKMESYLVSHLTAAQVKTIIKKFAENI